MNNETFQIKQDIKILSKKITNLSNRVNIIFDTLMEMTNGRMLSYPRDENGERIIGCKNE